MAKQTHNTSLILALHARYEKVWNEHGLIEAKRFGVAAEIAINKGDDKDGYSRKFRLEEAMSRNEEESKAVRLALLHQVPTTWQEALILAMHVWGIDAMDEQAHAEERAAASIGMDTLLDFMSGEIAYDGLEFGGHQLLDACNIVYERRRLRTGQVDL